MDIYLTVLVNADTGHAEKLLVKPVKGGKTPLYACEAGCQYDPVEVGCVLTFAWCVTKSLFQKYFVCRDALLIVLRLWKRKYLISENEVIETTFYTLYKMTSKKKQQQQQQQTNKQKSGVKFANCFSLAMFSKCYLNLFFLMPEIELENFIWNYFSFNYIESYKTEV